MWHKHREWTVKTHSDIEALLDQLTEFTSTPCTGFRYAGFLFLNDSFGPDGAQEYGVIHEADWLQVESLTVSWMTKERLRAVLDKLGAVAQPSSVPSEAASVVVADTTGALLAALGAEKASHRAPGIRRAQVKEPGMHRCPECA
jgi:hypothetical protein